MKKLLLLLCMAFSATCLYAQGSRHEMNVFIGGFYTSYAQMEGQGLFSGGQDVADAHSNDLWDLYEPHYSVRSGPVLTINYHYLLNNYLRVGGQLSYGAMSGTTWHKLGNKAAEDFSQRTFYVLPEIKACIPGPLRLFRLYGKAAVGMQYNFGTLAGKPAGWAWEVTPIGAEWGGQVFYGNAEFCWGSVIRGGRIGFGFRF